MGNLTDKIKKIGLSLLVGSTISHAADSLDVSGQVHNKANEPVKEEVVVENNKGEGKTVTSNGNYTITIPKSTVPVVENDIDVDKNFRGELEIYNVLGQKVKEVDYNGELSLNNISDAWDGTNESGSKVGDGVFLYRLRDDDQVIASGKLTPADVSGAIGSIEKHVDIQNYRDNNSGNRLAKTSMSTTNAPEYTTWLNFKGDNIEDKIDVKVKVQDDDHDDEGEASNIITVDEYANWTGSIDDVVMTNSTSKDISSYVENDDKDHNIELITKNDNITITDDGVINYNGDKYKADSSLMNAVVIEGENTDTSNSFWVKYKPEKHEVSGNIISTTDTNETIDNAIIKFINENYTKKDTANSDGEYSVEVFDKGHHDVIIENPDIITRRTGVDVNGDKIYRPDVIDSANTVIDSVALSMLDEVFRRDYHGGEMLFWQNDDPEIFLDTANVYDENGVVDYNGDTGIDSVKSWLNESNQFSPSLRGKEINFTDNKDNMYDEGTFVQFMVKDSDVNGAFFFEGENGKMKSAAAYYTIDSYTKETVFEENTSGGLCAVDQYWPDKGQMRSVFAIAPYPTKLDTLFRTIREMRREDGMIKPGDTDHRYQDIQGNLNKSVNTLQKSSGIKDGYHVIFYDDNKVERKYFENKSKLPDEFKPIK